ncbi:MAG: glycoside hydrolase family 38 C-terminal domain-containing protein [archaeon]|nr:glycoside hydrolase family 38 C-terminal domain-containing protein [archaeon]
MIVSVPPFGFVKPSESPQTPPSRGVQIDNQTADGITVSNTFFAATFGASGVLRSLMVRAQSDQQDDWEAIDLSKGVPGNTFRMFDDVPLFWDAWCAEMYHLEKPVGLPTSPTSYEVVGQSPLRVTVRFHTKLSGASSVVQTVSVSAVSPLIEFDTSVDWHENRKFLKVFFPLSVRSESARYHVPYGWISRPTHRNTSWDMAKFEVVGHYWADLSQYDRGVALINDCKYGYAVLESLMSLSLLRSSKYPDEHADMGQHSFRYALFPHHSADLAPVINQAQAFNVPLRRFESAPLAALTSPSSPWLVSHRKDARTPSSAVILDAIKLSEVDLTSTILRFYESLGGSTSVFLHSTFKVLAAAQCNLLEDPLHPLTVSSHGLVVGPIRFNPFEVVTVKLTL